MRGKTFGLGIALGIGIAGAALAAETYYVQPVQAQLRAQAQNSSEVVAQLKRGDSVEVQKKEGLWFQVKVTRAKGSKAVEGKSGWVSKLFVSPNAPVGEAEVAKELSGDQNLAKANRRRASSYAVSAATRGLVAGNRVRDGREKYDSDSTAVQKMDALEIPQGELQKFSRDAQLNP